MAKTNDEIPSPVKWKVITPEGGGEVSDTNRIVWTYRPNRMMTVRIKPRPSEDPRYVVEKSNGNETVTFEPPESDITAAVDLAILLLRGTASISFSKFKRRLGVSASAWRVHARVSWWDDLREVAYNGGFGHIDGVDSEINERLQQAITGPFLERSREEIVRQVSEDPWYYGVYVVIPVLGGWRVQKEWRCGCEDQNCDSLAGKCLLPLSEEEGALYTSREAAVSAAKSAAEDHVGDLFDDRIFEQYVAPEDIELLRRGENQPTLSDFTSEVKN